jgi:outer membrane receptor for ferrienterochelin and colicin
MTRKLLLLLLLCLSHYAYSQNILNRPVRLSRQGGTVGELLAELNTKDSVSLSYSSGIISLTRKIELTGRELTVEDHLKSILKEQPVKYVEQNGKIFLVFDEKSPFKKKITINGYITDKKSGERLMGASVYALSRRQGTTSNTYGFFSLTLDRDTVELLVSHSGYVSVSNKMFLEEDTVIDFALEQNIVVNEIVVINAESRRNSQNRTLPGKVNVPASLIKSLPSLMGEADVMKALQLLPGIQAGNEGTTGLNVRGGSADQNLILLDGVPVYNASHVFGLFSIFNADAVHNVEVLKSGFPASYGGRLSSVVDVQMKEGDKYRMHGEGGLGLIFSKLTLEGPIQKGKSSFLVAGRRTYADLIIRPILRASNGKDFDFTAVFSDLNIKTNFTLGKKDHLYAGFYTGVDKYYSQDAWFRSVEPDEIKSINRYGFSWGNNTAMMRWNHVYTKKIFSNLTVNYSRFRFKAYDKSATWYNDIESSVSEQRYSSSIQDINVKYDIDYLPAPNHFIKMGVAATLHHYRPGVNQYFQRDTVVNVDVRVENNSLHTGEYDLYAEDDIRLSSKMKINTGVRLSSFLVSGNFFFSVQPRINWLYKLNNKWSLRGSAVKMNQYIHLLTNSNLGLPTDLWLPVTKRIPPQVSYQLAGGISYSEGKTIEASAEIYYKHLRNVIEYSEGVGFNNASTTWEDIVEVGKGKTYGMELLFQKKAGKLTGLASYTLSWSNRQFANINEGKTFPYKYDRRHEIKMAIIWQPSKRFEMSCDWLFATGNAVSLPKSFYFNPLTMRYVDVYTGRNDYRMPDYHRMDVSMKFIRQRKKFQRTWVISVYNAYSRLNPFYIYRDRSYYVSVSGPKSAFTEVSLFPILPSVTYQFKF